MTTVIQYNPWLRYDTGYPDKHLVMTGDDFQRMYNFIQQSPFVTFDFETSGLRWFQEARACGLALAGVNPARPTEVHNFYIPFRHLTGEKQLDYNVIHPGIKAILENNKLKIAHNAKFDIHMARREGWNVQGPFYDTMVAAHLWDENRLVALKILASTDLNRPEADLFEKKLDAELMSQVKASPLGKDAFKEKYGYSTINIPLCGTYACFDVEFTTHLYTLYESRGLSSRYPRTWLTEMGLIEAVADMEEAGMPVDVAYFQKLKETLAKRQVILSEQITAGIGYHINLNADDEIRLMLRRWGCQLTKLTKAGNKAKWKGLPINESHYAVDKEVLGKLSEFYPILVPIMEWREAEKLRTTYTDSILDRLDSNNNLHCTYKNNGTDTGRLSCEQPNLQNQPGDSNSRAKAHSGKKLKDGGVDPWSIRRGFVNRGPDWIRLFYDYSQIELRVLGFYTKDPVMVDAYLKGEDIHSRTALEVFGSDADEYRKKAKVANFGISYCLSPPGFARQLGTTIAEAEDFYGKFYSKYSGISNFRDAFWKQLEAQGGYFQNIFGRPRRIPEIMSFEGRVRGSAERRSIGSLIQGTAAELTKESIVRLWKFFKENNLPAHLVATVHDEIQIDCHRDVVDIVGRSTKKIMEDFQEFKPIPIVVDAEYTLTNWAEKKGIADDD